MFRLTSILSAGAGLVFVAVVLAAEQPAEQLVPPQLRDRFPALASAARELNPEVLALGLRAFAHARSLGEVERNRLTIIDYSLPSVERRLWTLDLDNDRLLFHEWVAHGKSTGANVATFFSNKPGSRASSLGTFATNGTYHGRHGYSLRLTGLEPGINNMAKSRAIVIHAADYVSIDFIERHGRLGRSWGCPALRPEISRSLIDAIKGGSILFAYFADPGFEARSTFLE